MQNQEPKLTSQPCISLRGLFVSAQMFSTVIYFFSTVISISQLF